MDKEGKYWMEPGDWLPVGNLRKIENAGLWEYIWNCLVKNAEK